MSRSCSSNPKSPDSYSDSDSDSDSWDLEYWDVQDVRDAVYSLICAEARRKKRQDNGQ